MYHARGRDRSRRRQSRRDFRQLRRPNVGNTFVIDLSVLALAGFVVYAVISKCPNSLHTPWMSGTNSIHGVVVLGGFLLMHIASGWFEQVLLVIAVAFG